MTQPEPVSAHRPKGIVAVLDTSVLVRAWLSPADRPNASRRVTLLAGVVYNSLISPAILEETEEVLSRPRFGAHRAQVREWLDAFTRASLQVFPETVPGVTARVVGGDEDDLPVLKTALAGAIEHTAVTEAARIAGHTYVVSENTRHFVPGRVVYGWRYITAADILRVLLRRGRSLR